MADDEGRGTPPAGTTVLTRAPAQPPTETPEAGELAVWRVRRAGVKDMAIPSFNFTLLKYTNRSSILLVITELAAVMGVAVTTLKTALGRANIKTYIIDNMHHMARLRAVGSAMQNARSVAVTKATRLADAKSWRKLPAAVVEKEAVRLLMDDLSRETPPPVTASAAGPAARFMNDPARNPDFHPAVAGFHDPAIPPLRHPEIEEEPAQHPVHTGFPPPALTPLPPRLSSRMRRVSDQRSSGQRTRGIISAGGATVMEWDDDAALTSEGDDDYRPSYESSGSERSGDFREGRGALVMRSSHNLGAAPANGSVARASSAIYVADSFAPAGRRSVYGLAKTYG